MRIKLGFAIALVGFLLCCPQVHAGPVTLTSLIGDKDHGPYPTNAGYNEHTPPQIDPGDPVGFDWGYHAGSELTYRPGVGADATLDWTHTVDLTGLAVDSVRLDVVVIGFLLGPVYEKLFVGSPLTEIPNAFPAPGNDVVQTFSFVLAPSVLVNGSLPVQLLVRHDEGWGGVDYSELTVEAHTVDATVPEPASILLVGAGIALWAAKMRHRRRQVQ